jgi:hypothetical protein
MPRSTRGNAGESAVLNELVQRGFDVLVPFGDGHPYDLVVDVDGVAFVRIQCKTAWPSRGCMLFNARSTDHGRGPLSYVGRADLFGVYFPPNGSVYLVPIDAMNHEGRLRLEPARNNQRRRVRFAQEYQLERWTTQALQDVAAAARRAGRRDGHSPKSNGQALGLVTS